MPNKERAKDGAHFWIFSINYAPEPSGFAPHVTAFCEHLVHRGDRVTVFTGFPFAPKWVRWPAYKGRWRSVERIGGVDVIRHTHYIPRSPRKVLQRVLMEGSFCLAACLSLFTAISSPAAIIYVGAQPSLAMLTRMIARFKRIPYGIMVNDLATGAAADVGILRSGLIQRLLHAFEFSAYRSAAGAVVLCESFAEALTAEGISPGRIQLVRSPVDIEMVRPCMEGPAFRRHHGMNDESFIVLYAGSMGLKQGLENVIMAAKLLGGQCPRVRWVLVGEGETRLEVEHLVAIEELGDIVQFLPFQPLEQLSAMFSACDVCLLNQRASIKDTVIPSKLLTYMAAGRPVIAAVNTASQGAALLRASGGGSIVLPDSPEALADAVREMSISNTAIRNEMGRANRAFAEAHFDQRIVLRRLEEFARRLVIA